MLRVSKPFDRRRIQCLLLFQPGQWPQAGGSPGRRRNELVPRRRKGQQPQGMAGRRRIEDHMIELRGSRRVAEQFREFVEGRDLHRAGAGELLFHALDGLEAFERGRRDLDPFRGREQIGVGLVVRAAHPSAQLVQLGQAEFVRPIHDDGVGGGHVDARLDDGGAQQQVVGDLDACFRQQLLHGFTHVFNGFHFVVKKIDLPAALQFP